VERIAEILKQKLNNSVHFCWNLKFGLDLLGIFGLPLLQFNSRGMDRCFGSKARFGGSKGSLPYDFLSIKPGNRLYGVETVDTGDAIVRKKRQEINGENKLGT
jgi:hypothetical protein